MSTLSTAAPMRVIPLSGAGYAALASLRVEGQGGGAFIKQFFMPAGSFDWNRCKVGDLVYGHWEREDGEEVVVSRLANDVVEIHCHGGLISRDRLITSLLAVGCQFVQWEDWVIEQGPHRIEAEAKIALCKAKTKRVALILLDQLQGALRNAVEKIVKHLEEQNVRSAEESLENLRTSATFGSHLVSGWSVVLLGYPNVGKSSLINALLGYRRSIVLSDPGTTRDLVKATTAVEGWPIELVDTAGLRAEGDALEEAGMQLAIQAAAGADLVLIVSDASKAWTSEEDRWLCQFPNALVVHNKQDLASGPQKGRPSGVGTVAVATGGVEQLCTQIVKRLIGSPPRQGVGVPFTSSQVDILQAAGQLLSEGSPQQAAALLVDDLLDAEKSCPKTHKQELI